MDTYACALIFCRLLLLNHGVDVETSAGYAKVQAMLAEVQDACQGGRVVRQTDDEDLTRRTVDEQQHVATSCGRKR